MKVTTTDEKSSPKKLLIVDTSSLFIYMCMVNVQKTYVTPNSNDLV